MRYASWLRPRLRPLFPAVLLLTIATPPAAAQSAAELEVRIAALEQKLADIELQGMKVRAPFSVVNADGETIFTVLGVGNNGAIVMVGGEDTGGGAKILLEAGSSASAGGLLTIFGSSHEEAVVAGEYGGNPELLVGARRGVHALLKAEGATASVAATDGGRHSALLKAGPGESVLKAETGTSASTLGEQAGTIGLVLQAGGRKLTELSKWADRENASLRIYGASGAQVAGLGVQVGDADTGLLVVSGSGNQTEVQVTGAGFVGLKEGGAFKVILSAIDRLIALYGSGEEYIVTISESTAPGGGNVTTYGGGVGVFSAGAATDGGGEACVQRQENGLSCLGVGLPGMGMGR